MNKLIIYLSVFVLLVSSVIATDKSDYVQLVENTDYCFDCHTIYKITKADDNPLVKLGLDFKDADRVDITPDYEISYLKTEDYTELVDIYAPCALNKKIISNETGEEETLEYQSECYNRTEEVTKQRSYYAPVSSLKDIKDMYNSAKVSDSYYIMISGHLNLGEATDNILVLNDYVYDEYAWWNASFPSRWNIINTTTNNLAMAINGTIGFDGKIVWYNPNLITSPASVYNGSGGYAVANDVVETYFETESKNGYNLSPSSVYDSSTLAVFHFGINGTIRDSTYQHLNGSINNAKYVDNGKFGGAYNMNGSKDGFNTSTISGNWTTITLWALFNNQVTSSSTFQTLWSDTNTGNTLSLGSVSSDLTGEVMGLIDVVNGYSTYINSSGYTIAAGWHFITFRWNGARYEFWIDNTNQTTVRTNAYVHYRPVINGWNLCVGYRCKYADGNWDGTIDEFRIYNRTLNTIEMTEMYNNGLNMNNLLSKQEDYPSVANETYGREAVMAGIQSSEIASFYVAYDDKQVYIRLMNSSQYKGTFDKFIISDSGGNYKRWAFNYDQNTGSIFSTMFNITPVFYVWQKFNMTYDQIKWDVSAFVNSTYP
jgi:hypothetical protein